MDNSSNIQPPDGLNPSVPPPPPPAEVPPDQADDSQLSPRAWLVRNGIWLVVFAAIVVMILRNFGLDGTLYLGIAALGLGLVIFIHELGHFAVAKWCDVYVETFSIGFGPALPGCRWQWGETVYKIALFPLGGYVKMLGEGETADDSEDEDDKDAKNPRSYKNKTVGQRMAIISAGVIMNVLLAIVCFIGVYTFGKQRESSDVGGTDAGGPAWSKGLPTGAVLKQIGGRTATDKRPIYFSDLQRVVINSSRAEEIPIVYELYLPIGDPKATPQTFSIKVEARKEDEDPLPRIGVTPAPGVQLRSATTLRGLRPAPVWFNSPAAAAREAFPLHPEDVILATTDPDHPEEMLPIAANAALAKAIASLAVPGLGPVQQVAQLAAVEKSRRDVTFELSQRWMKLAGKPMKLSIQRKDGKVEEVTTEPARFEFSDVIEETTDPDHPNQVVKLPPDPRNPGSGRGDYFDLHRRMKRLAGKFMTFRVRRADGSKKDLVVPPGYVYTLPARLRMGKVAALREESPTGKTPGLTAGVKVGDIIKEIQLKSGDEERRFVIAGEGENKPQANQEIVDPVKLPFALQQWAHGRKDVKVIITVLRNNGTKERVAETLPVTDWDDSPIWYFDQEQPIGPRSPLPIPGLGIAYRVETIVEEVDETAEGLQKNDVIKAIQLKSPGKKPDEEPVEEKWFDLKPDQWAYLHHSVQITEIKSATLKVERGGTTVTIPVTFAPDPSWPMTDRGLILGPDQRIQIASNIGEAVVLGMVDTWDAIWEVYRNISGMITQRISPKNIGGPLTIGVVAYKFAGLGFWEFVFFIGMISVNLAVINFLPVPFLDGGHMMFLLYERIRGKPVPESVMTTATLGGVLLLISLMVFVLYLDVMRWFFS